MARWFSVLLIAVATLAVPATAEAGWKTDRAQVIAAKVWHDPCGGNVTVRWADVVAEYDGLELDCAVTLPAGRHMSWVRLCTVMIHEYGHAAGYRDPTNTADPMHSSNPGSVMFNGSVSKIEAHGRRIGSSVVQFSYAGYDRRCADHGRTYLGMKPSALAARETFR